MRWRTRATCARSFICRRSASTAIMPANGSTRPRRRSPASARGRARLDAERAWQRFGARCGAAVAILRLAGIYGPGQNALVQIEQGNARRIVKPGQVFNRIHVADIAQAIDAAFARKERPASSTSPTTSRARPAIRSSSPRNCSAATPPPEVPFEEAAPSHVADGVELLAGMPPRAQRQAQARTRRRRCSIRPTGKVCARCSPTR